MLNRFFTLFLSGAEAHYLSSKKLYLIKTHIGITNAPVGVIKIKLQPNGKMNLSAQCGNA